MKILKTLIVTASIAGLAIGATGVAADGAKLYQDKVCWSCHGAEGKAPINPVYPKLNGQNAAYCIKQIKDIKSGKRGNSPMMVGMVAGLTDADTTALCNYLSEQ